jgi:hypothetical protein
MENAVGVLMSVVTKWGINAKIVYSAIKKSLAKKTKYASVVTALVSYSKKYILHVGYLHVIYILFLLVS